MTNSMTGFARSQIQKDIGMISWEIRSLNSRYLDINLHLPDTFRELEPTLREMIQKHLRRGKIDGTLKYQSGVIIQEDIKINQTWLDKLHAVTKQIKSVFGKKIVVTLSDILRWPGIIQMIPGDMSELHQKTLELFEATLIELNEQRTREGNKLSQFIEQRLTSLEQEIQKIRNKLPSILEAEREYLINRLDQLSLELDKTRLEQEIALIAQKMDVSEELDRLNAHISEIKRSLNAEGEVGRRLDFLMQELNREANTLGSKSISEMTSHAAVEMKVLIEQMREQVQNIE